MNFGMITDELNMQETKQVIHSILNAGCEASIVIDRSSFEILYQNDKAIELMGNRVGMICHEVLCTKETPCMDCPMQHIKTQAPLVRERYEELLDGVATWRYHDIAWFDGRDAVLATLPDAVLGGCTIMMFGTIVVSGIQMLGRCGYTQRNITITALSLSIGLGFTQVPEIFAIFPRIVQTVFAENCVAVVFIVAIILNLVLPKNMEAHTIETETETTAE